MGILSNINRKRKSAQKKLLNPIVKGISKVSDKLIPNELRWAAPYAAGIGSLMLPGSMGPLYRALAAGGMNIAGQIGADETPIEDISDLNALSVALAGGLGALGSDSVSGAMRRGIETGVPAEAVGATGPAELGMTTRGPGFLQGAENIGREGIAAASDYITGGRETLANLGSNPEKLMSLAGVKDAASALGPTISQGTGDVFREAAIDYKDEADRLRAEEEAEWEATEVASDSKRAEYQMTFMRQAGIGEDEIKETLEMNELGDYYEEPVPAAQGGIIGLKNGGMLNFGGREMDLRTGGFVPIGRKERADDVPARLSKNEFVMTADAVRAAGGGSVNKGAQRMYDVMNKLEARA
jgi:hypothetical protein